MSLGKVLLNSQKIRCNGHVIQKLGVVFLLKSSNDCYIS